MLKHNENIENLSRLIRKLAFRTTILQNIENVENLSHPIRKLAC
jgi:hypothetical protein